MFGAERHDTYNFILIMKKNLFSIPVFVDKINPQNYNKNEIIDSIIKNYEIDPERNNSDFVHSNIHHGYRDFNNSKFIKINFDLLLKEYTKKVNNIFNEMNFTEQFAYNIEIVNYTCMKTHQFMQKHIHEEAFFSGVHYIKFNSKIHNSTTFCNPASYSDFIGKFLSDYPKSESTDINFSWLYQYWNFDIEEDDFILFPGILPHFVNSQNSDTERITIVFNVNTFKKEEQFH